MDIPKGTILDAPRSRGDGDTAEQADRELPGTVDSEEHSGLLATFGLDAKELFGGLGDRLGG
jgi:hypothetical protein